MGIIWIFRGKEGGFHQLNTGFSIKSKTNDRFYEDFVKKNDKIYDKRLT